MRQHSIIVFVAVAMIAILFQTALISPNCLRTRSRHAGTGVVNGSEDDCAGEAGCCASCFCCHVNGTLHPVTPDLSLVVKHPLAPNQNPSPIQLPISPSDKPPQT